MSSRESFSRRAREDERDGRGRGRGRRILSLSQGVSDELKAEDRMWEGCGA